MPPLVNCKKRKLSVFSLITHDEINILAVIWCLYDPGKIKNSWCYSYFTLIQIMNSTRSFLFTHNYIEVSMHWFWKMFITRLSMKFLRMPLPGSWKTGTELRALVMSITVWTCSWETCFWFSNFLEEAFSEISFITW